MDARARARATSRGMSEAETRDASEPGGGRTTTTTTTAARWDAPRGETMGARTFEVERGAIATVRADDDEEERARRGVVVRGEREEGAVQLAPRTKREFHDDHWTNQHLKLLYLVSKYSNCAQTAREKERWVRKLPLLVLIYEGIVQKVFEYDYAPESTVVKNSRVYLNVSQEGVDDLDDLIEGALLRGLRLSSTEHQSVLAFQITAAGLALVAKRMNVDDRLLVDELCIADGKLLQVSWED